MFWSLWNWKYFMGIYRSPLKHCKNHGSYGNIMETLEIYDGTLGYDRLRTNTHPEFYISNQLSMMVVGSYTLMTCAVVYV